MNRPQVVSEQEWQAARDALLVKEKEYTRALDALAAERRRLPMVKLDSGTYTFTAPDGSAVSLGGLFDGHRQLVIYHFMLEPGEDHDVLAVYHREVHTLPEEDRRRLRRRQRHYIEEWVHLLAPLRPDLTDGELRLAVHAAIGAIQSTLFFRSGLDPDRLARRLEVMAHGCLGTTPVPFNSELSLTSR